MANSWWSCHIKGFSAVQEKMWLKAKSAPDHSNLRIWTIVSDIGKEPLWPKRRGSCWCTPVSRPLLCLRLPSVSPQNLKVTIGSIYNSLMIFFSPNIPCFLCYSLDCFYWHIYPYTDFYFSVSHQLKGVSQMAHCLKNPPANVGDAGWSLGLVRKMPWRWKCQPTSVFLLGKSRGQRSLAG